jgi:hypothetical protein
MFLFFHGSCFYLSTTSVAFDSDNNVSLLLSPSNYNLSGRNPSSPRSFRISFNAPSFTPPNYIL